MGSDHHDCHSLDSLDLYSIPRTKQGIGIAVVTQALADIISPHSLETASTVTIIIPSMLQLVRTRAPRYSSVHYARTTPKRLSTTIHTTTPPTISNINSKVSQNTSSPLAARILPVKYSDQTWTDLSIIKRKGSAFAPDQGVIPKTDSMLFPSVSGIDLNGKETKFPGHVQAKLKLVCFSFTDYGFNLNKSFKDPFIEKYGASSDAFALEICFVEYGFLKMMQGMFQSNLKKKIPETHYHLTQVTFGGVLDFAKKLELPNKFAGYAFLVDQSNLVRWRGSGLADDNAALMLACAEEILREKS